MQTEQQRQAKELKKAVSNVNAELSGLCVSFHDSIPVTDINRILTDHGFNNLEPAIYCGHDSQIHEEVGHGKYLTMTWHKFDTGRYEIVAYLN